MFGSVRSIVVGSATGFIEDDILQSSAALAYYSLLSMAPLLLVVIAVAGVFFADGAVQTQLVSEIDRLVGAEGAALVETVISNTDGLGRSFVSLVIGAALTLFGASTVFAHMQKTLNRVWDVEQKPSNAIWEFIKHRLLSFALVLTLGFLLMISLVVSALLSALYGYVDESAGTALLWRVINMAVSFSLAVALIAMMFRYLPDARISWRDTWIGAVITALLFAVGKWAIGLYLGQASFASSFGAAGSAVVFMVWTYYASLIIFLGAEITHATTACRGARAAPAEHAQPAVEKPREKPSTV
jgi:membrane protein